MKDMWDDRYSKEEFAYGREPDEYFREQINKLSPGRLLLPSEGEGRNAVYAAIMGWDVTAVDFSSVGRDKALRLASENNVSIIYIVSDIAEIELKKESFDAVGLIYAHFPPEMKEPFYRKFDSYLKKGGVIIFKAFSKENLKYSAGCKHGNGPKDIDMLFSINEIKAFFSNYEIMELNQEIITMNEGLHHNGEGSVIKFTGRKL